MNDWLIIIQKQFKHPYSRLFAGFGLITLVIAIAIGIPDNPPGIILTYLASIFLVLTFVHHWREAGQFGTLLAVSVVSFPVLTLLHNVFEILHEKSGGIPVIDQLLSGLSLIFFLAAIFVSPVGIGIGTLLGLYFLIKKN